MTIQYVNTGSSPNKGDGDSLRIAFGKINSNFTTLQSAMGEVSSIITSATAPTSSTQGLLWYDTVGGRSYIFYDNNWVDASPYAVTSTGTANFGYVDSDIVPSADLTYNLGSPSKQWNSLYVGTSTIYLGGAALSVSTGSLTLNGSPVQGASVSSLVNGTHMVELDAAGILNLPDNAVLQGCAVADCSTGSIILIEDIMLGNPPMVHTMGAHNLVNGQLIDISGITSTVELNDKLHYVSVLDPSTIELYEDQLLTNPVNAAAYTAYSQPTAPITVVNENFTTPSNTISAYSDTYPEIVNIQPGWTVTGPGLDTPSADSTAFTVTKSPVGLTYLINGASNAPMYLKRGNTYTFNVNAPGHPMTIQTTGGGYNVANVYSTGVTGAPTASGAITFAVPLSAPSTLYYQCMNHAAMTGVIHISDGLAVETVASISTQAVADRILYRFVVNSTWPVEQGSSYVFVGTQPGGGQIVTPTTGPNVTIRSNNNDWVFDLQGNLTLPPTGDIIQDGVSVLHNALGKEFALTASNGKYVFNNQIGSPDLVVLRGFTYYFNANIVGHPFWIQTTPGAYNTATIYNSHSVSNNGGEIGTIVFAVPITAPDNLYYTCEHHPGMAGRFIVRNVGDAIDTPYTTDTACAANTSTVIYSSTTPWQHAIKLLVLVEGREGVISNPWDTQSCEIMIARSFRNNSVVASVYGVTYTSVSPLATFNAILNTTTNNIDVLCLPASTSSYVYAKAIATEITTSD